MRFISAIVVSSSVVNLVGAPPALNCTVTDFQGLSNMNYGELVQCSHRDAQTIETCMTNTTLGNITEDCWGQLETTWGNDYNVDCLTVACNGLNFLTLGCSNCPGASYSRGVASNTPVGAAGACGSTADRGLIAAVNITNAIALCGSDTPKVGGKCLVTAAHTSSGCQRCMTNRVSVITSRCNSVCTEDPVSQDCLDCFTYGFIGSMAYCVENGAYSMMTGFSYFAIVAVLFTSFLM